MAAKTAEITDRQTDLRVDHGRLVAIVGEALADAGSDDNLSVLLVGSQEMAALNLKHTGRDGLTDVLAFPMGDGILGDVVVCPVRAIAAAGESGDPHDEVLLYALHGTLHLLGYDDNEAGAEAMYAKEDEILARFGIKVN